MIRKKTYFFLMLCLAGFLTCTAIKYVENFQNNILVEMDFSGEEENESSEKEEKETNNEKLAFQNYFALFGFNASSKTAIHKNFLSEEAKFFEVSTPPPELA